MSDEKAARAKRRREVYQITQRTGARVTCEALGNLRGVVTGHYDDDSAYVLWDGATAPERIRTDALALIEDEQR